MKRVPIADPVRVMTTLSNGGGSVSDVYRSRDCLQKEIGLLKDG